MPYKIMIDPVIVGRQDDVALISEEGAKILWHAYKSKFPSAGQTMERRNERGGICWLSEIKSWAKEGYLPADFDFDEFIEIYKP